MLAESRLAESSLLTVYLNKIHLLFDKSGDHNRDSDLLTGSVSDVYEACSDLFEQVMDL